MAAKLLTAGAIAIARLAAPLALALTSAAFLSGCAGSEGSVTFTKEVDGTTLYSIKMKDGVFHKTEESWVNLLSKDGNLTIAGNGSKHTLQCSGPDAEIEFHSGGKKIAIAAPPKPCSDAGTLFRDKLELTLKKEATAAAPAANATNATAAPAATPTAATTAASTTPTTTTTAAPASALLAEAEAAAARHARKARRQQQQTGSRASPLLRAEQDPEKENVDQSEATKLVVGRAQDREEEDVAQFEEGVDQLETEASALIKQREVHQHKPSDDEEHDDKVAQ